MTTIRLVGEPELLARLQLSSLFWWKWQKGYRLFGIKLYDLWGRPHIAHQVAMEYMAMELLDEITQIAWVSSADDRTRHLEDYVSEWPDPIEPPRDLGKFNCRGDYVYQDK